MEKKNFQRLVPSEKRMYQKPGRWAGDERRGEELKEGEEEGETADM